MSKPRRARIEPEPVAVPPVLLWNNLSMRRAGLKGFRVEARLDGATLLLTGRRRGSLSVPANEIERLLVGYERSRVDTSWRALIWSPRTRRPLTLATGLLRSEGFAELIEGMARAMEQAGRLDRIETGQRIGDALVMPVIAVLVLAATIYGLWLDPDYRGPSTPGLARARLGATGLAVFLVIFSVWEFLRKTRPRRVTQVADIRAYLP